MKYFLFFCWILNSPYLQSSSRFEDEPNKRSLTSIRRIEQDQLAERQAQQAFLNSKFGQIPVELIKNIFNFAYQDHFIKRLRFVCKAFECLTRPLIETNYIMNFKDTVSFKGQYYKKDFNKFTHNIKSPFHKICTLKQGQDNHYIFYKERNKDEEGENFNYFFCTKRLSCYPKDSYDYDQDNRLFQFLALNGFLKPRKVKLDDCVRIDHLRSLFTKNPQITSIEFNKNNSYRENLATEIIDEIVQHKNLKDLLLHRIYLSFESLDKILDMPLEKLSLPQFNDQNILALDLERFAKLSLNLNLKTLDLGENICWQQHFEYLQGMTHLTELAMTIFHKFPGVTDFLKNLSVPSLILNDCNNDGLIALAENKHIKNLTLSGKPQISDTGIMWLLKNQTIERLIINTVIISEKNRQLLKNHFKFFETRP